MNSEALLVMEYRFKKILLLLLAFFLGGELSLAQQVQVTVNVLPPYSAYLQDYPGRGNQVQIFVRNTTTAALDVRFLGQITGDNGVRIATPQNFRPLQPLRLAPLENKLLTRNDLEGLFDLGQIEVQGIDKAVLYRGLPLPEGSYQLCIRAFDNRTSRPLSADFPLGCSGPFMVRSIEPPILISPICDSKIAPNTPQNIVFSWTPPVGVSPGQVSYTLRILELPLENIDPNVFIEAVVVPPSGVEVKNIRTNSFLYGPNQPPLKVGKRYAVRIQAIDLSRKLNFLNDGKSPVCFFDYGSPQPKMAETGVLTNLKTDSLDFGKAVPQKEALTQNTPKPVIPVVEQKVMSGDAPKVNCHTSLVSPNKKLFSGNIDNKTLKIGEFELIVYQAALQNNSYTGEGRIKWNGAPIRVKFSGLQVNTDDIVIGGTVKSDDSDPSMPKIPVGTLDAYGGLPNNYFDDIKTNLLEAVKQNATVKLPLKYEASLGTIGVNQMVFGPQGADMDMVLGIALPEANLNLFLAAVNVCMSPNKLLPNTGTLGLVKDFPLPIPGGIGQKFVFKKSDLPKLNGTYANVVGGEFDKVHAVLDLNMGGSILKLDDGTGQIKAGDMIATVTADFVQWSNWIGTVSMPKFQVPGLSGVTFTGMEVQYDHSDVTNPDGFDPPQEFSGEKSLLFHGVFFKNVSVELPSSLKSDPRIGISVKGGIVNGTGFTGLITPANKPVLDYAKGQLGGFGFSIDDINILIVENGYKKGQMLGKIQLPISDDPLVYTSTLQGKFDQINFLVTPASSGYKVPLFAANMTLSPSTTIEIDHVSGQKTNVEMNLVGQVSINTGLFTKNKSVQGAADALLPKLYFENFVVTNNANLPNTTNVGGSGVFLSTGSWSLKNDVAKGSPAPPKSGNGPALFDDYEPFFPPPADDESPTMRGFPIDFDMPKFITTPDGVGLEFGVGVNIGGEEKSIAAAKGTFQLLGTLNTQNGRYKPVYKDFKITKLSLKGDLGVAQIEGDLEFFDSDATYGDGFFGKAIVNIPSIGSGLKMKMLFGKKSYHYAYLDGTMLFSPGVPMVGPLTMNGFGGGILYNVKMQTVGDLPKPKNVLFTPTSNPGATLSGIKYVPEKGAFGLKARVIVGLIDTRVFAGLAELNVGFDKGGLNNLTLKGIASVLNTSGDPEKKDGVINAEMMMGYSKDIAGKGQYDLNIDATGQFLGTTVTIPLRMHYGSEQWHIKLGDPYNYDNRMQVKLIDINTDMVKVNFAINGYVAVGNSLNGLPPLPSEITNSNDAARSSAFSNVTSMNQNTPQGGDFGLMLGGGLNGALDIQAMPFRVKATAVAGFDAGIFKNQACSDGKKVAGYQGWYGNAQLYAQLQGGIDIFVDTWFFEGSVNIMTLKAGAVFSGGLPNPTWGDGKIYISGEALDGLISVSTSRNFSFGEKCVPAYAGDPLKNIEIISQITPENGSNNLAARPRIAVAFNMPIGKTFNVYLPTGLRQYTFITQKPTFSYSTISQKNVTFTNFTPFKWSGDKRAMYFEAVQYLPSYSDCKLSISVEIKEYVNGILMDPYIDSEKKRVARSETRTSWFKLGPQPTSIPLEDLEASWPVANQHYFLRKEQSQGFIKGNFEGLDFLKQFNNPKMEMVAIFKQANGYTYERPLKYDGNGLIRFAIPSALKKQTNYQLTFVSRTKVNYDLKIPQTLTSVTYAETGFKGVKYSKTALNLNILNASFENSNNDAEFFKVVFRTSKYDTFKNKMQGMKLTAGGYNHENIYGKKPFSLDITGNDLEEDFDNFEIFGGKIYNATYAPMVKMKISATSEFDKTLKTNVYDVFKAWSSDIDCPDLYNNKNCYGNTLTGNFLVGSGRNLEDYQPEGKSHLSRSSTLVNFSNIPDLSFGLPPAPTSPFIIVYERDGVMLQDMLALAHFMKQIRIHNENCVKDYVKFYLKDKNPSFATINKYIHDAKIANNDWNGTLKVSSPSLTLNGHFYWGRYQSKQYWKTAEDKFYSLLNIDYDAFPKRKTTDGFTIQFDYNFQKSNTSFPDTQHFQGGVYSQTFYRK